MPVSHLGLTVSNVQSATSFYLATLAPLGYRVIGQDGTSIGLGIRHADLFLTQEPRGRAVSPAHIAFTADSRLTVRNCYAAALSSGAHPSGAPSYRDRDCTVFNAAVEDLDGNVIEFVHKELADLDDDDVTIKPAQANRVVAWQESVASSGLHDDIDSLSSRASRAKSRAETVGTLAKSFRSSSEAPSQGVRRAATLPASASSTIEFPSKAFLGGLLGATAGAALAWAMMNKEDESAREEATYEKAYGQSTRASTSRRASVSGDAPRRNFSVTESRAPKSHRNFSTTESAYSRRYPPRSLARSMRAIQPTAYYEDEKIQEALDAAAGRRLAASAPQRSRTCDAIGYAAQSHVSRRSHDTVKRSSTLPPDQEDKPGYHLEAPKTQITTSCHDERSHHSTRRPEYDEDDEEQEENPVYYLEAAKPQSTLSRQSGRSHHSSRRSAQDDDQDLKRRDSGISMGSHRSHHSRHSRHSAAETSKHSSASTIKPSRREPSKVESAAKVALPASLAPSYASAGDNRHAARAESRHESAAEVPIPAFRAPSHAPSRDERHEARAESRHESAAGVPMPASRASSYVSARNKKLESRAPSHYISAAGVPIPASVATTYVTAAQIPIPESHANEGYEEESDGLADMKTVVPDDSISCVDFSKRKSSSGRSTHSHKSSSKQSDAARSDRTVKPGKESSRHSAATLPVRDRKEDCGGKKKRSTVSYA